MSIHFKTERALFEYLPKHWMISVGTIIGDEALMLSACLEAIIASEGLPPDENWDTRVGRTPSPTLGHLKSAQYLYTLFYEWTFLLI